MRILQDIGDLLLLALISPMAWAALTGLLFLTFAIGEARSTEEGSRRWRDYVHSGAGRRRIAAASILLVVVAIALFRLITAGSHGYCATGGKHHSDEEYIRVALKGNIGLLVFPRKIEDPVEADKLITNFLVRNPDCCKVFRARDSEVGNMSWVWWRNNVVVRIRNEESLKEYRRGEKIAVDNGLYYATVDNCLDGSHVIMELIPGG